MGEERTELTGRLREDIERTRADMSWTIGEIEERLRPERLVREAKTRVSGVVAERMKQMMNSANETAGRMADRAQQSAGTVADRVRENPIPLAALAAAGLAWWMSRDRERGVAAAPGEVSSPRRSHLASTMGEHPVQTALLAGTVGYLLLNRSRRTDGYHREVPGDAMEHPAQDVTDRAADAARKASESVSEYAGEAREAVARGSTHVGHTMREYGSHAREAIGGYVSKAQGTAVETTGRLREKARHLAGDVQHRWEETSPAVERWIHDNPLAVGAAALAVGAAVGLSAPRTRAENRTLGQTRDALMDKAATAVRDAGEKAKSVVQDVSDAARAAIPPAGQATSPPSRQESAPPSAG